LCVSHDSLHACVVPLRSHDNVSFCWYSLIIEVKPWTQSPSAQPTSFMSWKPATAKPSCRVSAQIRTPSHLKLVIPFDDLSCTQRALILSVCAKRSQGPISRGKAMSFSQAKAVHFLCGQTTCEQLKIFRHHDTRALFRRVGNR
jgi:hypothetical protein